MNLKHGNNITCLFYEQHIHLTPFNWRSKRPSLRALSSIAEEASFLVRQSAGCSLVSDHSTWWTFWVWISSLIELISKHSLFSIANLVDFSASTREKLSVTQIIGTVWSVQPAFSSENKIERKIPLSITSDTASVSSARVLLTILLILFDCHEIGGNCPLTPIKTMRCQPSYWKHLSTLGTSCFNHYALHSVVPIQWSSS